MSRAPILDFGGAVTRTAFQPHDLTEAAPGRPASACVFVDDRRRHVTGPRAIGLPTVHFDVADPAASYSTALQMLGLNAEASP